MLCATIVPIVVSIPEAIVEALKAGRSLFGRPSKKLNDADGCANLVKTTEKNCLRTPPVSIPGWPRILTRTYACLLNLLACKALVLLQPSRGHCHQHPIEFEDSPPVESLNASKPGFKVFPTMVLQVHSQQHM